MLNAKNSSGLVLAVFTLAAAIPVASGGMITAMHLLGVVVLPVLLSYVRRDRMLKRAWILATLWTISQVLIDRSRGAEVPNQIEIVALATVLTLTVLVWLHRYWGVQAQTVMLCAGMSWLVLEVLAGNSLSSSNPWKYGLSAPVTVILLGVAYGMRSFKWAPVLGFLILGGVSLAFDTRSQTGFMLLAALIMGARRLRRPAVGRVSRGLLIAVVGVGVAGYVAYPFVAAEGFIGQRAQAQQVKYDSENADFVLATRLEFPQLAYLASANLPFGVGAYEPVDSTQSVASLDFVNEYVAGLGDNERTYLAYPGDKYVGYNAHSAALASALYGGIPAALVWIVFIVYIVRGVVLTIVRGGALEGHSLYLGVLCLWDSLFSPLTVMSVAEFAVTAFVIHASGRLGSLHQGVTAAGEGVHGSESLSSAEGPTYGPRSLRFE